MLNTESKQNLLKIIPNDDILSQCIHCGLCLAVCPTYDITKQEKSSPRGRIKMIKSVAHGELQVSSNFAEEMNFCLDCQACETACPAGVKYGSMVEAARVVVNNIYPKNKFVRLVKKLFLRRIIAKKTNLKFFSNILYIYQRWGFQKIIDAALLSWLSPELKEIDKLAPRVSDHSGDFFIPELIKSENSYNCDVAFHTGCFMEVMFAEINRDTVDVLHTCGCSINTPRTQFCCGSLHAHNGDMETAVKLAKKNIDMFSRLNYDYLISNSAGCGAFMKEYVSVLKDDEEYHDKAKIFSGKVKDIMEFLDEKKPKIDLKTQDIRVCYDDPCHLVHSQKVFDQPRNVLAKIPGLELIPLEESTWCCGSAGVYNIFEYENSMKFLSRKMEKIRDTKADVVATGNPGCIQQIRYGAKHFGVDVQVLHPVTILKKSLNYTSVQVPNSF